MLTFFGIVFLVYGGMHLYAFAKVWQAFPHTTTLGAALVFAGLLLSISPLFIFYAARQHWHNAVVSVSWPIYVWMGYIFLFFAIGMVLDAGHLLTVLLGLRWPMSAMHMLLVISLSAFVCASYGLYDARQIRIEHITIATPKLKNGSVTIAQVSDMHLGAMLGGEFLGRVIGKLNEIKPDIIVATGDIVDGQGDHLNGLAQRLRTCTAPMGKFAVLGNHEYYVGMDESLRFLDNAGFAVLRGEAVETGGIVIAGVDDPAGSGLGRQARLDADTAIRNLGKDDFVVLLKHQPVVDMNNRFDLQLSGHIHGGQIFPFNYLTKMTYKVETGLARLEGGRWLYVSRGTGTWGPPMRLLAPPEVTLITLTSASSN